LIGWGSLRFGFQYLAGVWRQAAQKFGPYCFAGCTIRRGDVQDAAGLVEPGLARGEEGVYIMYKHGEAAMKARVQKWGNSLGIRIPRTLAMEVSLETDSEVDLTARDGTIVISPSRQKRLSLRQLLSKVTDSNLHAEIPSGESEGREGW
jgi:antitoxin MazE